MDEFIVIYVQRTTATVPRDSSAELTILRDSAVEPEGRVTCDGRFSDASVFNIQSPVGGGGRFPNISG